MEEHPLHQFAVWFAHIASLGGLVGASLGVLPPIGAIVAIIWYVLNILDHPRVQKWMHYRRARKIARLEAKLIELRAMSALEPEKPEN